MIHVACNIDSNYVKYCGVTLVSLFENNRNERITVHLLANELTQTDEQTLRELAARYGNECRFYTPDMNLLKGFEIRRFSKRISLATYYRCLLADVLPTDIDRVLYLDCDIIVRGDILPYWNTPMDEVGVAAVEDVGCREMERYTILQYPAEDSYFNAGVLLVNLDYWRRHQVGQCCVDYYHQYPERILYNDQDLLNRVLHDHKKLVDLRWNVQDGFYRRPRQLTDAWRTRYAEVLRNPVILHYTNRKPWDYENQHPLRQEYFRYLALTPWKDEVVLRKTSNRVRRFFRLLPFYIGLRKPKYVNMNEL